jgi:starch synthase
MKVLFVAAEAASLAEVGGLAEVVGSLPKSLMELGHDVRVIIPRYGFINTGGMKLEKENIQLSGFAGGEIVNIWSTLIKGKIPSYLLANQRYFDDFDVYGGPEMDKFLFFSKAIADLLPGMDWQPDIIHCHDWHTALAVMWIRKLNLPFKTVFTIHNLAYQGRLDWDFLNWHGLAGDWRSCADGAQPPMNFLGQGIINADLLNTVSNNYAREILTPGLGEGLEDCLQFRKDSLYGITNGIDYEVYDPAADKFLSNKFSAADIGPKAANKAELQRRTNLPVNASVPLIGLVQRLEEQKGMDILDKAVYRLLAETDAQFVILGRGREWFESSLKKIAAERPDRVFVETAFDDYLAHLIYAGSDMFLMPSKFEPCGLGQMIAMRYGTIPLVRHTGGLVDTVPQLSEDMTEGNGFVFHNYSADALADAAILALDAFKKKAAWTEAASRIMRLDFSWKVSAGKYAELYGRLLPG